MLWIWALLAVIVIIVAVTLSWVKVHIVYKRESHDDQFDIEIRALFGAFRYRYSIPIIRFEGLLQGISIEKEKSSNIPMPDSKERINVDRKTILTWYEESKVLIHHVIGFHHWLIGTLKHTHCSQFSWVTHVGLDDAPETAITVGMIWGLKTSILGMFFNRIKLESQPQLAVVPQFNYLQFKTHFDCNMKIRLGYCLLAIMHLVVRIHKVKGGIRAWRNILSKTGA